MQIIGQNKLTRKQEIFMETVASRETKKEPQILTF
jgi:hypothetical protein